MDTRRLATLEIRHERDVVRARQTARELGRALGLDGQDQSRVATAVSEIARNAFRYAGGGTIAFAIENGDTPTLVVTIRDRGPGLEDLASVLQGRYKSRTGMGMGIVGTRRLMDRFEITSRPGETVVVLGKEMRHRRRPFLARELATLGERLDKYLGQDPFTEIETQNRELLATLNELRQRQAELEELNRELEDTNRGVVALYAELDEKAESLQRANEVKTRFISNMSHEFRTPLNSILSLSRILLDRVDGELTAEQEKQVQFVRRSAEELAELVNDLLDIAKVEAGKISVRPSRFEVSDLFGGLRGMLRPLLAANSSISLVFEDAVGVPTMETDEGKVSQILRNFISNALKFTERGEVRVRATAEVAAVRFSVQDTGVGIAKEDQERIFDEFVQLDGPLQRRQQGTGLGLPLSRRLADLLGGRIIVESEPEVGSTFSAVIPVVYSGPGVLVALPERVRQIDPTRLPILVVEDNLDTVFTYEKFLKGSGFQAVAAGTLAEARAALAQVRPAAIVLDVLLRDESSWDLLRDLKADEATRDIPVLVVTVVDNEKKALALGADAFAVKPVERAWLLRQLRGYARRSKTEQILIVDDDEVSRYVLRGLLADTRYTLLEAADGAEALRRVREEAPAGIFLDLVMPGLSGEETLRALKSDPVTRDIPVVVYSGQSPAEVAHLDLAGAVAVLSKDQPSREAALLAVREALVKVQRGRPRDGAPVGVPA